MKKYLIILAVLALMVMAQECQTNNKDTITDPYVGGTQGLQITFEEQKPPEFIYDNGDWEFYVSLLLENMGESYIEADDVKVEISGLQAQPFDTTEDQLKRVGISQDIYSMEKLEDRVINPEPVLVDFGPFRYLPDLNTDFGPFPIRADVCYSYATEAVALGCILEDPTQPPEDSYCEVDGEKSVYSSGAPMQITNFYQSPAGRDKVKYTFTIEHQGQGRFFAPQTSCDDAQRNENKVHFAIETLGDSNLQFDCVPVNGGGMRGDLYLGRDGTVDVSCIQQQKSTVDSTVQLNIELNYDYLQTKEIPFLVKAD